jgi:hypothetical protein
MFQPQTLKKKQLSFRIPRAEAIIRRCFVDNQSNAGTTFVRGFARQQLEVGMAGWRTSVARFLLKRDQPEDEQSTGKAVCDVKWSKNKICRVAARTAATF